MSDNNKDFNPEVAPPAGPAGPAEQAQDATPPSAPPAEVKQPAPAEGTGPSADHDKVDSLGNAKEDAGPVGPRGTDVSPEHLSEPRKAETAAAEQARLTQGMASTDDVDSIGNEKGHFRTEDQGFDRHGAKIPDKVTDELVEEAPAMVGPRGKGAPPESFHGKKS